MATIGTFKSGTDYTGRVETLTLNVKAKIATPEKDSERAPDYRIFAGDTEFGAAWKRTSRAERDYLSVKLVPIRGAASAAPLAFETCVTNERCNILIMVALEAGSSVFAE